MARRPGEGALGLCKAHAVQWAYWRRAGIGWETFLAQAPQPGNRRVLSLRGLPDLVRWELLYVIGCRLRE